mmetsp:Transcript_11806/g.36016  ORF Transcript_11806/g.36016 Transcript_11806/m.36016 type:complete len:305 (+) Transcript_11806:111-1025(+)|eukprot:CAMPEP_0198733812 /NCGR_PEP_ID=MMETSP1475-20131203/48443_1 /TAXON_ID= ORGANISM="Unidentified sp., Strain CCMP1999" /NCGR_SAMPLE_ID=MMETSP1475 /ASSEMBLY_ACC=CAM_ASM_001111 /LENGTH=304 /DNA_ID=CAMNT_0044497169 /DNA_START=79 /DNA_END=993 /DNA_ORIENTATION=+
MEESVEAMQAVFPGQSREGLMAVLKTHGGNVDLAMNYLLLKDGNERATGRGGDRRGFDVRTSQDATAQDEEIARQLQEEMFGGDGWTRGCGRASSGYVRDSTRDYYSAPMFSLERMSPEQVADIVKNIKEIVVPALQGQIAGVVFPPIENSTEKLHYSLQELRISKFDIPVDSVDVKISGTTVYIEVQKVDLELEVGTWKYEKTTRPRIHDTGSAKAFLKDVDAVMKLVEGSSIDNPLKVEDCDVKVGRVTLKTSESRASWLYNSLAVLFRPALKSSAEQTLQVSLTDAIQQQAGDWSRWVNGE